MIELYFVALGKKMASSNYHDDSEADAVKEDLQRAESTSQQKWSPSPVVPAVVGQFKRKLNETKFVFLSSAIIKEFIP